MRSNVQGSPSRIPAGKAGRVRTDRRWLIAVCVVASLSGTVVVFGALYRHSTVVVLGIALQGTELQVETIAAMRQFYASEVAEVAVRNGLEVTHDYKGKPAAIPLPATLTMHLNDRVEERRPGAHVFLYSDYPFPWRKSRISDDPFAAAALGALRRDPGAPFYRFESFEGRPSLRYAICRPHDLILRRLPQPAPRQSEA